MTGCEVLVIQQNNVLLFKVRHDGSDLAEYIEHHATMLTQQSPLHIGALLRHWWDSDIGKPVVINGQTINCEIDTRYPNGYHTTHSMGPVVNSQTFDQLQILVEAEIEQAGEDGYLCSYCDYTVLVNCDTASVQVNL